MERKVFKVNDRLVLKKAHPCGSQEWTVLWLGSDIKMQCSGCGRVVFVPRSKLEKRIKKIISGE